MPEDAHQPARAESEQQPGDDRGQEAPGAGGREPVEVVARGFRRGFGHDRRCPGHRVVQVRDVPTRRPGSLLAVRQDDRECRRGGLVHRQLDLRQPPDQHEDRENGKGHPGLQDLPTGVSVFGVPRALVLGAFVLESVDGLGLPEAQEDHRGGQRGHAAHNVHEVAVYIIRPVKLHQPEGEPHDQDGGQHLKGFLPTHHSAHEPEGNDDRCERKDAAGHGIQVGLRQRSDGRKSVDWRADGAPGHRRGVGDQVERRGVERFEAQADHEGAGDSHRSAEPSRTLDERAEAKGHQQ